MGMSKRWNKKGGRNGVREPKLRHETKKSVIAVILIVLAVIFFLASFKNAGPLGTLIYKGLGIFLGWGYFVLPGSLLFVAGVLLFSERQKIAGITFAGGTLLLLSVLGLIELIFEGKGGWLGLVTGSLRIPFGKTAALIIHPFLVLIAILVTLDLPLKIRFPKKEEDLRITLPEEKEMPPPASETKEAKEKSEEEGEKGVEPQKEKMFSFTNKPAKVQKVFKNYVPPPLSLLKSAIDKPTTGDLRANANVIKRTLESFGIPVEMGEINIGPKVTRYTLKPAEGMKLSRITALNQDLALALAAHPIRIEAPIPGKSLVGIEVPNKAAALVRLGSLMAYPEFQGSGPLGFVLGRDVSGEPIFADIDRMPHLLVAGATGSGKSVAIHSLIISLLYKNSPETLRLMLIDPKRVELSVYENIPHLISPVITEGKKAAGVFRWAISEMERRYDLLLKAGSRDVRGYNSNLPDRQAGGQGKAEGPLPYILIVVDELADIMTSYGREVEGSIVRLAQMARATGIHLVLSTQRPSVEVITGLIKANITSRIALQVASQVDSRTIIDTGGAEKLLGGGDLLFISSELSKPKRIQGAYIPEEEIDAVADFIRENNVREETEEEASFAVSAEAAMPEGGFDEYLNGDYDDLLGEAVRVVGEAKKASASLLQRRLRVGYARAARLLDLMEGRGLIGPGEGAKPREVFMEKIEDL